jgi:nicotinamide riboside transporter PnuC
MFLSGLLCVYVSIRQHTSAYEICIVSRTYMFLSGLLCVSFRMLTYADVYILLSESRMLTYADVC